MRPQLLSISPQSRLDRFMDLKHVRGFDFIYFIIHSLVYCTREQPSCRSVTIMRGNIFSRSGLRLLPESNLFLEWENCFICRCGPLEVTLIHKCRHTWAHNHVCADTYILYWRLVTPLLDVYLNEKCGNKKITAMDKNRIFSHYATPILLSIFYAGYLALHQLKCPHYP